MVPLPLRRRFAASGSEVDSERASILRNEVGGPLTLASRRIYEMLACFEAGDYLGALSVSDDVLGAQAIVSRGTPRRPSMPMTSRAAYVLSLVEENGTLEELVYATGLPMLDALRSVCELVETGHLRVDSPPEPAPSHIRVTG